MRLEALANSLAAQQLKIASNDVPFLKDAEWHDFTDAFTTIAHMAQWSPFILDLSEALPAAEELSFKQKADLRNAYSLFKTKTRGHPNPSRGHHL